MKWVGPAIIFAIPGPNTTPMKMAATARTMMAHSLPTRVFCFRDCSIDTFLHSLYTGFVTIVTNNRFSVNRLRIFAQNFFGCYFLKPVIYDAQKRPFRFDPEGAFSAIQFAVKLLADYSSAKYLMVRTI